MKESQKRARMETAVVGLSWLLGQESARTRKEIFIPLKTGSPAQISEALKKPWQTELLDRLIEAEVLERVVFSAGSIGYKVKDTYAVEKIVRNFEQDGSEMAKYLWPGHTILPERKEEEPEVADSNEAKEAAPDEKGASKELMSSEDANAIVLVLKHLVEVIGSNQKVFLQRMDHQIEGLRALAPLLDALSKAPDDLKIWGNKQVAEQEKKLNGVGKRLEELEHRVVEAHKLVEASHVTMKTATAAVNKLTESAIDVTGVSKLLEAATARTTALQQAVDALVKRLNAAEDDKVGKLLKKLDANASESASLREMMLELLAGRRTDGE